MSIASSATQVTAFTTGKVNQDLIKLHQIEGYIQTIYLAEYPDKLLLLDGACRVDVETICHFITESLKRPLSHLKLVVSTHMHPDHAGAAEKLRKKTGCDIASADVAGHWYSGLDGIMMFLTDMALAKWVAKRKGKQARLLWYNRKLKPTIKLQDGQPLPGFKDWQVLFTQGHTNQDISLYHCPSKKVYVADLLVKVKGRYLPPFPVFYPNRYKTSLARVEQLKPSSILLAHQGEVTLSHEDYEFLKQQSPDLPMTHWRSVKSKFIKALSRG